MIRGLVSLWLYACFSISIIQVDARLGGVLCTASLLPTNIEGVPRGFSRLNTPTYRVATGERVASITHQQLLHTSPH